MSDQETLSKLSTILGDLLGDDVVLTMTTTRPEVAGWDSFAYVNFIVAVEVEFNIKFQVADVESFENVGDIVQQIKVLQA